MTKPSSILSCRNIQKSYKMGSLSLNVLKGLNVDIQSGEFAAITGSSGSGKSTLLHLLGALDVPDKGDVIYENKKLSSLSSGKLNRFRNREIGFVFQFYHLLEELNVLENVLLPAMVAHSAISWIGKRKEYIEKATIMIDQMGLVDRIKHRPNQLSGGERQRVAIARSLINQPKVLLADEPTGNLDWKTGQEILAIFDQLHKAGQTIVMVTHDQRVADRADREIRLEDGRIA